jgi:hypothetical protein
MLVPITGPEYNHSTGCVECQAFGIGDAAQCQSWLQSDVRDRLYDAEGHANLVAVAATLNADGFDMSEVDAALAEPEPEPEVGDIGECIAELFLMQQTNAIFPWNKKGDMKSMRASLPGTDLVGYRAGGTGGHKFLFGEVKASFQAARPPTVMAASGKGMVAQLFAVHNQDLIRSRLMKYAQKRANTDDEKKRFKEALISLGEGDFYLEGVLVRDTAPHQDDIKNPAAALSQKLAAGRDATLYVLYVKVPIADWVSHCAP